MHHNPSYLGGLAEIEPHYFKPEVPEYLQHIVSDTPLDRGDGIRAVPIPPPAPFPIMVSPVAQPPSTMSNARQVARVPRNFGAPCLPCQAKTSRRNKLTDQVKYGNANANANANANEGMSWDWLNRIGKGGLKEGVKEYLSTLNEDEKKALATGVMGQASLLSCEKFGLFCPTDFTEGDNGPEAVVPTGLYVAMGVMGVAILGLGFYAVTRGK
jgi:hypothetical protein